MLEIVAYPAEPLADKLVAILGRRAGVAEEVDEAAREILRQVKVRGDEAVAEFTRRFDGVEMVAGQQGVAAADLERALAQMMANCVWQ